MGKNMRKTVLAIISAISAVVLVGCAATTTSSVFGGSYFLSDYTTQGVGVIDETVTYDVTFTTRENTDVTFDVTNGSYVMHAYTDQYEGTPCYRLDTTLSIAGRYSFGETTTPVNDLIETTAYFYGVDKSMRPVYSKRSVKAHSIIKAEDYVVQYYEYETETVYGENDATVTFTPNTEASTGDYSLEVGETKYNKVFDKVYLDNETLLFALRAFKLTTSTSTTFNSIDAISKTNRTLVVAAAGETNSATNSAESPLKTLDEVSYVNAGEKITSVSCFRLALAVNGTYAGSNIILYYSDPANQKEGQKLIKMEVSMPLMTGVSSYTDLGVMTYLIRSVVK